MPLLQLIFIKPSPALRHKEVGFSKSNSFVVQPFIFGQQPKYIMLYMITIRQHASERSQQFETKLIRNKIPYHLTTFPIQVNFGKMDEFEIDDAFQKTVMKLI